jgi:hypothetical protein
MSHLYESKIKNMGNAGRNGGEYYTPLVLCYSRCTPLIFWNIFDYCMLGKRKNGPTKQRPIVDKFTNFKDRAAVITYGGMTDAYGISAQLAVKDRIRK